MVGQEGTKLSPPSPDYSTDHLYRASVTSNWKTIKAYCSWIIKMEDIKVTFLSRFELKVLFLHINKSAEICHLKNHICFHLRKHKNWFQANRKNIFLSFAGLKMSKMVLFKLCKTTKGITTLLFLSWKCECQVPAWSQILWPYNKLLWKYGHNCICMAIIVNNTTNNNLKCTI